MKPPINHHTTHGLTAAEVAEITETIGRTPWRGTVEPGETDDGGRFVTLMPKGNGAMVAGIARSDHGTYLAYHGNGDFLADGPRLSPVLAAVLHHLYLIR